MIRPLADRLREALDRGHFDGIPHDPSLVTPLEQLLGPEWMVLDRLAIGTSIALHRGSGAWSEVAFEVVLHPEDARVLADALKVAAKSGVGGQYVVEAVKIGEFVTATATRVEPRKEWVRWHVAPAETPTGEAT
jgi:hypothetical protein